MNLVILITCANKKEARKIARHLVKEKLVACVNLVEKIESVFWWQGKVDSAGEVLLIIKSKKSMLHKIIRLVKLLHSYQVPEVIALPIVGGNQDYMDWINESIG